MSGGWGLKKKGQREEKVNGRSGRGSEVKAKADGMILLIACYVRLDGKEGGNEEWLCKNGIGDVKWKSVKGITSKS